MMSPRRWKLPLLIAIGALAFGFSAWRVAQPRLADHAEGVTVLRFSHWQLEPGVREAFDRLSRAYEALHPGVRIEQIAIPGRLYRQWTSSQLIGGDAPDLVQIGLGIGREHYSYFQPITAEINQPNPYNAGTALAGVPWRNTFLDGMRAGLDLETREYYGASLFNARVRFYCNLDLVKTATGTETLPRNYAELVTLCAKVEDYARRTGEKIEPIAGSAYAATIMLGDLFNTQTQRLTTRLGVATGLPPTIEELYLARLQGRWSLQDPAICSAARLMQEASRLLTPGFEQIENDQTIFRFAQGRAALYLGYSLMATSIFEQCPFRIGIMRNPLPDPNDPNYGEHMIARSAETSMNSYGAFGITRTSRHPELALDFMRFLTSRASCVTFTSVSQNLPTLVGVEPPESMRGFSSDTTGYPPTPGFFSWGEVRAAMLNHQHTLFAPEGSVDQYLRKLEPDLVAAMRTDFSRGAINRLESVRRTDLSLAAGLEILTRHPDDAILARKFDVQQETQNEMEANAYYTQLVLDRTAAGPGPQ